MNFSALHEKLNQYINKGRLKSPWVVHYDCGSCNGCDIEVLACLTPVFDVERFGIVNIGDPKPVSYTHLQLAFVHDNSVKSAVLLQYT